MIRLISFLGNPGKEYQSTRHNLPWLVAERLTEQESLSWQSRFKGIYSQIGHGGSAVLLLKPLTFMNNSGRSVLAVKTFYKLTGREILIVHDEIEMKQGKIDLKFGGGLKGHNGLQSVASALGTPDFHRLRIGAGRPDRGSVSSHVLKKLSPDELELFEPAISQAVSIIVDLTQKNYDIEGGT